MPTQQNCKHLVTIHRAKQHCFYNTDDQKSLTTASPLVLGKPSFARSCPKQSLWRKWLQDMAVEMKGCILTLYPYNKCPKATNTLLFHI